MEDARINFNSRKQGGEADELETRKVARQYIPSRDYFVAIDGARFWATAEVEEDKNKSLFCVTCKDIFYEDENGKEHEAMPWMLSSFPHDPSWPWGALIERDICRQAEELSGSAWRTEYEEEDDAE